MKDDVLGTINSYTNKINAELKRYLSEKKTEADKISLMLSQAVEKLEEFTLNGGKRLRTLLIVIGYLANNGNDIKSIVKASISIEMMHSFLLIHDDIIDDDDFRRNAPTLHKSMELIYGKASGKSLSIILGDLMYCYAMDTILHSGFSAERKTKAADLLANTIKKTCFGQFLDVVGVSREADEDFIGKIHENKTAYYSVAAPLMVGAVLAGASNDTLLRLKEIGIKLGLAFQLKDDILGVFGDEKELGKPVCSDLVEGKKTLLIVKAKSRYVYSNIGHELNDAQIKKIRSIIIKSGSLRYSEELIDKLTADSKALLKRLNIRDFEKSMLMYLADYLAKRRS